MDTQDRAAGNPRPEEPTVPNRLHDLVLAAGVDDDRILAAAMFALGDRIAGRPLRSATEYGQAVHDLVASGARDRTYPVAVLLAAGWLDTYEDATH